MTLNEIYTRITRRTGEATRTVLADELNLAIGDIWRETDPPGCLQEVFVSTVTFPVVTLPPYVYQLKGIRYARGQNVTLYTPRAYYNDDQGNQSFLEIRELGHAPLIRSLSGAGRVTARLNQPNGETFRVSVAGPDASANHATAVMDFGTTDVLKESTKALSDVIAFTKNKKTETDVMLYDVANTLVGILLADQLSADCLVLRVVDPRVTDTSYTNTVFQVLYKKHPPVFTDALPLAVEDSLGLTLIDRVSAELLARSKDAADQGRARAYDIRATKRMDTTTKREGEAKNQPIKLSTSPYYHLYSGNL